jgi:hypothetical protein
MNTITSIIELINRVQFTISHIIGLFRFRRKEPQIDGAFNDTQALFPVKHVAMCIGFDEEFIRTSRQYFGQLSNPIFGDRDLICILLGCPFPMVLRKISNHYELRGQIYVEGIMNGEAMACLEDEECKLQDFELR